MAPSSYIASSESEHVKEASLKFISGYDNEGKILRTFLTHELFQQTDSIFL
jgi:hypothetical protein